MQFVKYDIQKVTSSQRHRRLKSPQREANFLVREVIIISKLIWFVMFIKSEICRSSFFPFAIYIYA